MKFILLGAGSYHLYLAQAKTPITCITFSLLFNIESLTRINRFEMKKSGGRRARLDTTVDYWWDCAKLQRSVVENHVFCQYLFSNINKRLFTQFKHTISLHYFINDLKHKQYSRDAPTTLIITMLLQIYVAARMIIIQYYTITIHSLLSTFITHCISCSIP